LAGRGGQCVAFLSPLYHHLIPSSFTELTFIVLAHPHEPSSGAGLQLTNEKIQALPMTRDVNLFKNPREDLEIEVECNMMIACTAPYPSLPRQARTSPDAAIMSFHGWGVLTAM
jgi:hypothetical protein